MLKPQRPGPGPDGHSSGGMCVPQDDRPRKKLSFREPEVVTPTGGTGGAGGGAKNGQHGIQQGFSVPLRTTASGTQSSPILSTQHAQSSSVHPLYTQVGRSALTTRPHSIAGIVGLGGFSALGGVAGVTNPSPTPSQSVTSPGPVSGVTTMLGNPGLLGTNAVLDIMCGGQVTPILTPPTSPTRTSSVPEVPPSGHTAGEQRASSQPPENRPPPLATQQSYPQTTALRSTVPQTSAGIGSTQENGNPHPLATQQSYPQTSALRSTMPQSPAGIGSTKENSSAKQPILKENKSNKSKKSNKSNSNTINRTPSSSSADKIRASPISDKIKTHTSSGGGGAKKKKESRGLNRTNYSQSVPGAIVSLVNEERSLVNGRRQSYHGEAASVQSIDSLDLESQAMRIVRTVGQAFEVCHKISVKDSPPSPDPTEDTDGSEHGSEISKLSTDKSKKDLLDSESVGEDLVTLTPTDSINEDASDIILPPLRPNRLEPLAPPKGSDILGGGETYNSPLTEALPSGDFLPMAVGTPLSVHHELQLMREQLEQQQQQTQAAVAQVHLLRDQLAAETAARLEAQARTHQLLVHNKELLEHIQALVMQVRDLEIQLSPGVSLGPASTQLAGTADTRSQLLVTSGCPPVVLPGGSPVGPSGPPGTCGSQRLTASAVDLRTLTSPSPMPASYHRSGTLHQDTTPPTPSSIHCSFLFPSALSLESFHSPSMAGGLHHLQPISCPDYLSHSAPPSREPSPRISGLSGSSPLVLPLPEWPMTTKELESGGEITLAVPQQDALSPNTRHQRGSGVQQQQQQQHPLQPHQQQLQQHQQQQQRVGMMRGAEVDYSSTPSLSSESSAKRDSSGHSSADSVTAAVALLYSMDHGGPQSRGPSQDQPRGLPQVPEDSAGFGPYGPVPLGTPRNLNGPITRTASERVSRQDTLAQLQRMAWARHTTK